MKVFTSPRLVIQGIPGSGGEWVRECFLRNQLPQQQREVDSEGSAPTFAELTCWPKGPDHVAISEVSVGGGQGVS